MVVQLENAEALPRSHSGTEVDRAHVTGAYPRVFRCNLRRCLTFFSFCRSLARTARGSVELLPERDRVLDVRVVDLDVEDAEAALPALAVRFSAAGLCSDSAGPLSLTGGLSPPLAGFSPRSDGESSAGLSPTMSVTVEATVPSAEPTVLATLFSVFSCSGFSSAIVTLARIRSSFAGLLEAKGRQMAAQGEWPN